MTHLRIPPRSTHPRGFRFEIDQKFSGITVILGANGAGKTSFLEMLHGMSPVAAYWDGEAASSSRNSRGYVSQAPIFFTGTVEKNLFLTGRLLGLKRVEIQPRVDALLKDMGLEDLRRRNVQKLSGGEQALLALARARLNHPSVLLLDEVTANLDPNNAQRVERQLQAFLQDDEDHAVFFVTHQFTQAKRLADNIIAIEKGKIAYCGPASEFWKQLSKNQNDDAVAPLFALHETQVRT